MKTEKKCNKCGKTLPISEFHRDKSHSDGLRGSCKYCECTRLRIYRNTPEGRRRRKAQRRKYRKEHPVGKRSRRYDRLKHHYGITIDQYDKMFEFQDGVCAICKRPETAKNQYGVKRLSVDHDHKTGKVRGLLCHRCNLGIGAFKERPDLLFDAIQYLAKHL